jgi:hypothetical protein
MVERDQTQTSQDECGRFRRWWLLCLAAVALGVVTTFATAGTHDGVVSLGLWVALVASGAMAFALMRKQGR